MRDLPVLPVTDALPALRAALDAGRNTVLVAPPGAGKTTLVPLALLDAGWRGDGRILMLELCCKRAELLQVWRLIVCETAEVLQMPRSCA